MNADFSAAARLFAIELEALREKIVTYTIYLDRQPPSADVKELILGYDELNDRLRAAIQILETLE
jgi:hypothetical protein